MQTSIHRHRPLGRDMDHPQTRSPAWEAFSRRNCTSLTDNKISAPQETDMSPSQLQNRALQNMVLPKIHWINPEGRKPNCSIRMLTSHCHSSTWYQHVTPNLILQNLFSALAASTDSVHDYPWELQADESKLKYVFHGRASAAFGPLRSKAPFFHARQKQILWCPKPVHNFFSSKQ